MPRTGSRVLAPLLVILSTGPMGLAAGSAPAVGERAIAAAALERLGLADVEVQALALPELHGDARPEGFAVEVAIEGVRETLLLERASLRATGYRVLVQTAGGELALVAPPPVATYRGVVLGRPGWIATASLDARGLTAGVLREGAGDVFVQPARDVAPAAERALHLVYAGQGLPGVCGADALAPVGPVEPGSVEPGEGEQDDGEHEPVALGGGACLEKAQIAFDVDHEYYLDVGSSVPQVIANVEAVLNTANAMYVRDVGITHEVTQIIVRADPADPYSETTDGGRLDEFRDHWNASQGGVARDMAHLVMGYDPPGNVIGLAWVGVVCDLSWAYGWSQFTFDFGTHANVLGHEMGHNWAAPHCLDEAPCNSMCGGCLVFGPVTQERITGFRDSRPCLQPTGGEAIAYPPNARPDALHVDAAAGPVVIDVLANDTDGNCDGVTIEGFEATTLSGGAVTRSVGTGPGGRDELVWTPGPGFVATDTFAYTAGDGTGATDTASVAVFGFVPTPELVAHWRLDELVGSVAADAGPHGLDGNYSGGVTLGLAGAGAGTGAAAGFNGFSARVAVTGAVELDALREDFSVAAWVRPDSTSGWRRILANAGSWAFGLVGNDLVLTTTGIRDHVVAASVASGSWTHVAAVHDRARDVTLYVNGVVAGVSPGVARAFAADGAWRIGALSPTAQLFAGRVDDVQVYGDALAPEQVARLFAHPGATLDELAPAGTAFCFGDGTGSACPCGNEASSAGRGCAHSGGTGMAITAYGSRSLAADALVVEASHCPPLNSGIFYAGKTALAGAPLFDGLQCAGGETRRFGGVFQVGGVASDTGFVAQDPSGVFFTPGSTTHFQYWTRDVAGGPTPCGALANFSPAVSVVWTP